MDRAALDEKRTYPPQGHLIRHLRMDLTLETADELRGVMPVSDDLRDVGGALRMGALATLVDVAAGMFSHEMVRPDWLATTDMRVIVQRPSLADEVGLKTTTLRAGKRSIMSATSVFDDEGEIARGWVTYTRLPRRDDSPHIDGGTRVGRRQHYVEPSDHAQDRPALDAYVGIEVVDEALAIELEHGPQIQNSFGSLQGGAAAILVERLSSLAFERATGQPGRVDDLHVYYLGQTRAGPFRAEGTTLRVAPGEVVTEVSVLDAGNDRALLDLGTATAKPIL